MRRITLWLLSTLAAVVLLFSYRTSMGGGTATTATGNGSSGGGSTGSRTGGGAGGTAGGNGTTGGGAGGGAGTTGGGAGTSGGGAGTSGGAGTAGGGTGSTAGGTAYNGSVAPTRWGDVQVSITVAGGRITGVTVPVYPTANGRDRQINARALPILNRETMAAQSADIDTVSGATVTSDGYKESLQAALDAAHLS